MEDKKKLDVEDVPSDIYSSFNVSNDEENNNQDDKKMNGFGNNYAATKAKRTSRLLLIGFYLLVIIIGVAIFLMFRSDRYEFYLVKDEVNLSNGSSYQIELTPKNASYFDYLNYTYKVADDSVAKVDEFGTVTAVGTGSTKLKISLKNGLISKEMRINTQMGNIEKVDLFVYRDQKLLKDTTVNMSVNESLTLKAVANDNDSLFVSVQYESSDPDVAVVDSFGNVTAKSSGIAVINGTNGNVTGEITINVLSDETTVVDDGTSTDDNPTPTPPTPTGPATKISLGSSSVTKYIGESISFKVKADGTFGKVKWSSNKTSVATVDQNGVVKAVGKGTAIIKAETNGLLTTCSVIVKEKPAKTPTPAAKAPAGTQIKAREVTLNKTSLTVSKGKTATFEIKVSGALGLISVSSSNSKVATVKVSNNDCNGLDCFFDAQAGYTSSITYTVTGVSAGTAYINVNLSDLVSYNNDKILTGTGKVGILVQ